MAVGTVQEVKYNVKKQSKKGSEYTVTQLVYITESGTKKTESCFSDCEFSSVLNKLTAGDKIEAKYTKNGDYFNLVDVKLLEKGSGVAPLPTGGAKATGSYGAKDPETQAMILRQNALTNAVNFVTTPLVIESLKKGKETPPIDFLSDLVICYAKKFEGYTSGKEALSSLVDSVTTEHIEADIPEP